MKHKFASKVVFLSILLALIFSGVGVKPAQALGALQPQYGRQIGIRFVARLRTEDPARYLSGLCYGWLGFSRLGHGNQSGDVDNVPEIVKLL